VPDQRNELPPDRERPLAELINVLARVACQGVGLLLVAMGACYAISVFSTVGAILKNPQGLQAPVEAMAATIHADELKVTVGESSIAPGHVVALLLVLLWHMFWAWIPLALLAAGGRLLYWTFHAGPKPGPPQR
jgi:hypothetical protein